jgi:hypothetical protein
MLENAGSCQRFFEGGTMSLFHRFDASAYEFFEGLSYIDVNSRPGYRHRKARYGFVDREGKMRIPAIYDEASDFCGGLATVKLNAKWGYIDTRGNAVIPFIYDEAHVFTDGIALVKLDGRYGYIDTGGNAVIPFIYDEAHGFAHGIALVRLDGRYGYIDTQGNKVAMSGSRAEYYFREGLE